MESEKRVAYAALDIGTSQMKMGVYCPFLSEKIILINSLANELMYGSSGEVRAEYSNIRNRSFLLFEELGQFLEKQGIEVLFLGICGHVSSLLEWKKTEEEPSEASFPIWLDTTCSQSLEQYNYLMGNGKSKQVIGTFLPAGTNWLFTKLLHRKESGFPDDVLFLQVSDAIFYELTGRYASHFSSQISMVDLREREYAEPLLEHLKLPASALPALTLDASPVLELIKTRFHFPGESFVFPAMADLYTSLFALQLQDREGFMLANTSEQAGAFFLSKPAMLANFLQIPFDPGYINYGSTNTGGNLVNWFFRHVLRKEPSTEVLQEYSVHAAAIRPEETPILLPYLQGERAPLWNSQLTASILELKSMHMDVHLFRALLESIAFARRQCFEQLGIQQFDVIKLGGGSSKSSVWNIIRASVLNKQIAVADEKELTMAGLIYYVMAAVKSPFEKPPVNFSITAPDKELIGVYDEKYRRFIHYQNLLS